MLPLASRQVQIGPKLRLSHRHDDCTHLRRSTDAGEETLANGWAKVAEIQGRQARVRHAVEPTRNHRQGLGLTHLCQGTGTPRESARTIAFPRKVGQGCWRGGLAGYASAHPTGSRERLAQRSHAKRAAGYNVGLISGATTQQRLYRHLGFVPFGPPLGTEKAPFQGMSITWDRLATSVIVLAEEQRSARMRRTSPH